MNCVPDKKGKDMAINITNHAEERIVKRCGLNKKSVERNAELALTKGIKHSEISGSVSRFLDRLYLSHKIATNMRIFNGKVYLFAGNTLITVIKLPYKYHKTINKIKQRRNVAID